MKRIRLRANAKLNLSLDVTGVREDGYHEMDMVNRSVTLSDEIEIRTTPGTPFSIHTNRKYIPTGEKNLIWKAAAALGEATGTGMPEVAFHVRKVIPTQAGLGGGSADAAAALIGLNRLLGLKLSGEELERIGLSVGADVPFCIRGGCLRATGVGEILEPAKDGCRYGLVLVMPHMGHSTGEYFAALDSGTYPHPDTGKVLEHLAQGRLSEALAAAGNVFEAAVPDPETGAIKERLMAAGAVYSAMTGTGAAVFGVFTDRERCREACESLREADYDAWQAAPCDRGVDILEYRTD